MTSGEFQGYEAINWQNINRDLSPEEIEEIRARVSGLHFSKEAFQDDPIAMQGLYAAEALLREVDRRRGEDERGK